MTLAAGRTLASYRILGPLGSGGMGEVYRASDTRLGREVAIKVLPADLAHDPERLRRFEREARTLAALNHPNVATIHGFDEEDGVRFLVLELVEGEDLARRLQRGPLPLDEALELCRQIATGLEAAHEAGIVHRDLKPANVRVTGEGLVKVLDFGLAKPTGEPTHGERPPDSALLTEEGLVLGTPTYMSPEQARGRPVDRRTDVWAFGCVLFECLSGLRPFAGAGMAELFAAILESEPAWAQLPSSVPPRVLQLLRRTLEKDPRRRLQHLGDARIELELALEEGPVAAGDPVSASGKRGWTLAVAALLLGGLLGTGAARLFGGAGASPASVPERRSLRLAFPIPPYLPGIHPRLAPDGSAVVFPASEEDEQGEERDVLWLRRLDADHGVRIAGTENPTTLSFSPDGREILVAVSEGKRAELNLVRVLLGASPRVTPVGPYPPNPNWSGGMVWTEADEMVTTGDRMRLLVVPLDGSPRRELPITGAPGSYTPDVYRALPGGSHVFANGFAYEDEGFQAKVLAIDVRTGEAEVVLDDAGFGAWSPSGQLFFSRRDALYAVPFDPEARRALGTPRFLLDGLRADTVWRPGWFDVARDGTLIHEPGGRLGVDRSIALVGPEGAVEPWCRERLPLDEQLRAAFDGSFVSMSVVASSGLIEVWGSELDPALPRPLLAAPRTDYLCGPVDGSRRLLYYSRVSRGESGIWRAPIDAPERQELLLADRGEGESSWPLDLSPDGETLLVRKAGREGSRLVTVSLAGEGAPQVHELIAPAPGIWGARFSPDGRWLTYVGDLGGQRTPLVRPLRDDGTLGPALPVPLPLRTGVVTSSIWSRLNEPGRQSLLLCVEQRRLLEVDLLSGDPPRFSEPRLRASFEEGQLGDFESLPDGRLLAILRGAQEQRMDRIEVVLDAFALLER